MASITNSPNYVPLNELEKYCRGTLDVIRKFNEVHHPVSFVSIATFIGYLSRLAYGSNVQHGDSDSECYKNFIKIFMPRYAGICDQMYSTLRCGLVHAMSFCGEIPVSNNLNKANSNNYRTHWMNQTTPVSVFPEVSIYHKMPTGLEKEYCNGLWRNKITGSYIIIANKLCNEVENAIDMLFYGTTHDAEQARRNAELFIKIQRPILDDNAVGEYVCYPTRNVANKTQIEQAFLAHHP